VTIIHSGQVTVNQARCLNTNVTGNKVGDFCIANTGDMLGSPASQQKQAFFGSHRVYLRVDIADIQLTGQENGCVALNFHACARAFAAENR